MTKHDLKELAAMGAELGAAKAENDRLRGLLEAALYYVPSNKTELRTLIDNALSQQAEPDCDWPTCECALQPERCKQCDPSPTDTYTAVDMATAAAQGFRDGQAAAEQAAVQDERDAHQYAFEVGGTEDGNYILTPEELDEVVRRANESYEDVLRSLACSLGAGGYNARTVDPDVFEQKIRWGIDQLTQRIDQLARPAQTEQQPDCDWCAGAGHDPYGHPCQHCKRSDLFTTFAMHQRVRKTSGSEWQGHVCGTYSTPLTPEGYAVESEAHAGSVQIYPAKALELVPMAAKEA